jgi:hypothetical protein
VRRLPRRLLAQAARRGMWRVAACARWARRAAARVFRGFGVSLVWWAAGAAQCVPCLRASRHGPTARAKRLFRRSSFIPVSPSALLFHLGAAGTALRPLCGGCELRMPGAPSRREGFLGMGQGCGSGSDHMARTWGMFHALSAWAAHATHHMAHASIMYRGGDNAFYLRPVED